MNKQKVFILGVDGASPEIIDSLVKQGQLPNFQRIISKGVTGRLKTTIPPVTPCAWSSFMTGKNPGKHGICEFFYLDENHEMRINSSKSRNSKDLWEYLSKDNLRSLVFNVPFTYPPKEINGVMVCDFTSPSVNARFTYPAQVRDEILKRFKDFKVSERNKYAENRKLKKRFRDEAFNLADTRYEVAEYLMKEDEFDFSMVVFMLVDHIQHWYWKYFDEDYPKYESDIEFKNTVINAYKKMDSFLGKFMEMYPNHNILIMSDHGGGPYYKDVTINKWLMDNGYLFLKGKRALHKRAINAIGLNVLITKGLNLGLWKIINKFPFIKRFIRNKLVTTYKDIDWERTTAYSYGYYGPIHINRRTVKDKEEFVRLKEEIKEKLHEMKDPYTGEPLIKNIWEKEELYDGEKSDILPDIITNMGDFAYGSSSTFAFSSNEIFSEPKTFQSGSHTQYGVFMAYGPDIKEGEIIDNAQIYDIAPTVLHVYGIPVPGDMDGRVLKEIFRENSGPATRDVRYQSNDEIRDIINQISI